MKLYQEYYGNKRKSDVQNNEPDSCTKQKLQS